MTRTISRIRLFDSPYLYVEKSHGGRMLISSPTDLPIPRNLTALMQLLQLLVGPAGHRHWCGGLINSDKAPGFLQKMIQRYPSVLRNARQRSYDRACGRASVRLVVYPLLSVPRHNTLDKSVDRPADMLLWWLLSTDGTGGLADPLMPDHHVANDAMNSDAHIEVGDYVLAYVSKPVRRELIDKRTGAHRSIWKSTSTWTWKLRHTVRTEVRAAIVDCCRNLSPGRETTGELPGHGLRCVLAAQRQRPLFSGVRNDVIELHRYAQEHWLAHEPRWLAQRTAEDSSRTPILRPLGEVLATQLPLMRRIAVFDQPPQRVADVLQRMRTSDADQSSPDT